MQVGSEERASKASSGVSDIVNIITRKQETLSEAARADVLGYDEIKLMQVLPLVTN